MSKIVFRFGLIASVILILGMVAGTMSVGGGKNYSIGEVLGYIAMIIALSTIFFGVRKYKEQNDNLLSFGEGFKVGILITLLSSAFYVLTWLTLFNYTDGAKEMMESYFETRLDNIMAQEIAEEEIQKQVEAFEVSRGNYMKSTGMQGVMTFLEIFPVGLLLSLVAALVLRKKG